MGSYVVEQHNTDAKFPLLEEERLLAWDLFVWFEQLLVFETVH